MAFMLEKADRRIVPVAAESAGGHGSDAGTVSDADAGVLPEEKDSYQRYQAGSLLSRFFHSTSPH